mgnify:CR=1 FL=1
MFYHFTTAIEYPLPHLDESVLALEGADTTNHNVLLFPVRVVTHKHPGRQAAVSEHNKVGEESGKGLDDLEEKVRIVVV